MAAEHGQGSGDSPLDERCWRVEEELLCTSPGRGHGDSS